MIKEFEDISKNGTEKRWLTLVLPTLMERLLSVDKYAELVHEKVNLYVDELWGYQNVFDEMEGILNRELFIKNIKFSGREFDTLKCKKVPQSLEIGLFFCQIFIFII